QIPLILHTLVQRFNFRPSTRQLVSAIAGSILD
ncbi:MAG: hypothetical protein ACI9HA_002818, partial [Dinoroseobacter sp.]